MQWLRQQFVPKRDSSPFFLVPATWDGLTEQDDALEGSGFELCTDHGVIIMPRDAVELRSSNMWMVRVAGVSFRAKELQNPAFAPGKRLSLAPDPKNAVDPNAVAVLDAAKRMMVGYVPAGQAPEVKAAIGTIRTLQGLSLFEFRKDEQRVGLRIIIAPRVDFPRRPTA